MKLVLVLKENGMLPTSKLLFLAVESCNAFTQISATSAQLIPYNCKWIVSWVARALMRYLQLGRLNNSNLRYSVSLVKYESTLSPRFFLKKKLNKKYSYEFMASVETFMLETLYNPQILLWPFGTSFIHSIRRTSESIPNCN